MDYVLTALGVLACLLLLAGFLIRQGLYGWPKNARLLCRACGYLLEGLDRPKTCPECGADLTRRRAVRVGEHRRRKRVLIAGCLLLLVAGLLTMTVVSVISRTGWDWNRVKPVWMLRREARDANAAPTPAAAMWGTNPALTELGRRWSKGELSQGQMLAIVEEDALTIQGDSVQQWDRRWGLLIEDARRWQWLTPEQLRRYVRQAYFGSPQAYCAHRMHPQTTLSVQVNCTPLRTGNAGTIIELGAVLEMQVRDPSGLIVSPPQTFTVLPGRTHIATDIPMNVDVGTLSLTWECTTTLHWFQQQADATWVQKPGEPVATWKTSQPISIEVVAPSQPLVEVRADDSLKKPLTDAMVLEFVNPFAVLPTGLAAGSGLVAIDPTPIDISFDILARLGDEGREELIGTLVGTANSLARTRVKTWPTTVFPGASKVDIVLRTNPKHAERWLTIKEVWDGEIVVRNVPVAPKPPDGQPPEVSKDQ